MPPTLNDYTIGAGFLAAGIVLVGFVIAAIMDNGLGSTARVDRECDEMQAALEQRWTAAPVAAPSPEPEPVAAVDADVLHGEVLERVPTVVGVAHVAVSLDSEATTVISNPDPLMRSDMTGFTREHAAKLNDWLAGLTGEHFALLDAHPTAAWPVMNRALVPAQGEMSYDEIADEKRRYDR